MIGWFEKATTTLPVFPSSSVTSILTADYFFSFSSLFTNTHLRDLLLFPFSSHTLAYAVPRFSLLVFVASVGKYARMSSSHVVGYIRDDVGPRLEGGRCTLQT